MVDREVGLLEGLSTAQYYNLRKTVTDCILATDMTRHKIYLDHLSDVIPYPECLNVYPWSSFLPEAGPFRTRSSHLKSQPRRSTFFLPKESLKASLHF